MIGDCSDIPVRLLGSMDTPTTARQPRHRVSTSSGRPVDLRAPRRWTPRFLLGSGRARARPQPVPMNLLRPASLPLPRQRPYFLRRSSGGTTSCCFERCCVERYIIVVISLSLCPTIYLSVSRSKRRTFRTGTVISGIREHF